MVTDDFNTSNHTILLPNPPGQTLNPNKTAKVGQKQHTVQKIAQSDELHLSPEIRERLLTLQNKGLDLNQILGELLDQREQSIQQEKQLVALELQQKQNSVGAPSRHIPQKIRNVIKKEYGNKCSHQKCQNVALHVHHKRRFALNPSHDPAYLVPLCKQHHEIAHVIDQRYAIARARSLH